MSHLSIYPSVHPPICPSTHSPIYPPTHPTNHPLIHPLTHSLTHHPLPIHPSIHTHPPICPTMFFPSCKLNALTSALNVFVTSTLFWTNKWYYWIALPWCPISLVSSHILGRSPSPRGAFPIPEQLIQSLPPTYFSYWIFRVEATIHLPHHPRARCQATRKSPDTTECSEIIQMGQRWDCLCCLPPFFLWQPQ